MLIPEHIQRSFHWWYFQLPKAPERTLAANDFAFLDYLWDLWTRRGYSDAEHIAQVKKMFAQPGVTTAALNYYRAASTPALIDPALRSLADRTRDDIHVPTLAIFGSLDARSEFAAEQAEFFTGEYRFEIIEGAEHFVHRERPKQTTGLLLDWLR